MGSPEQNACGISNLTYEVINFLKDKKNVIILMYILKCLDHIFLKVFSLKHFLVFPSSINQLACLITVNNLFCHFKKTTRQKMFFIHILYLT